MSRCLGVLVWCAVCVAVLVLTPDGRAGDRLVWELTGGRLTDEAFERVRSPVPPVRSRDVEAWIRALELLDGDSAAIRALHAAMAEEYAARWVESNERIADVQWASRLSPGPGAKGEDSEAIVRSFGAFAESWHERFMDDFQLLLPADRADAWERVQRMAFRRRVMGFIGEHERRGVLLTDWLEPMLEQLPPGQRAEPRRVLDEYLRELDPLVDRASSAGETARSAVAEYRRLFPNAFSVASHHDTSTPEGRQGQSLRDAANRASLVVLERYDAVLDLNTRYAERLASMVPELIEPEMAEIMRPRQRPLFHDSVFPYSPRARFLPALRLLDPAMRWVDEEWIRYRGMEPNRYSLFAASDAVRRGQVAEALPVPTDRQRDAFDGVAAWYFGELRALGDRYRSLYPSGGGPSRHGAYRAVRATGVTLTFAGQFDMTHMGELNRQERAALMEKADELRAALQDLTERRNALEAEAMQRLRAVCSFEQRLAIAPY